MSMNFENISKFFTLDFFENLMGFIFEESFDSFYERKLKERRCYIGYDDVLWQMTEDDYGSSDVYPINYDYFLNMYNNVGCCTNFVDERLFCIKYLIKELFEKSDSEFFQNENISIKLNKNIVINEYKKVFITDLEKFDYNLLILNDNPSIDLMVKKFFCFIFDYIQAFLENFLEKIIIDNEALVNSYTLETKYNLISARKNKTKEEYSLCRNIKKDCKNIRNKRFDKNKGRDKSEIVGYFPYNYEKLELEIKRIKNEYNAHPFIHKLLRKIKKGKQLRYIKYSLFQYLSNRDELELYITLGGEVECIKNPGIINDVSMELLNVINNYIKFKSAGYYFTISDIIRYTLLEISGDLKLYQQDVTEDFDILKNIYNDFARRKGCKRFSDIREICCLYKTQDFIEKYNLFLKI